MGFDGSGKVDGKKKGWEVSLVQLSNARLCRSHLVIVLLNVFFLICMFHSLFHYV